MRSRSSGDRLSLGSSTGSSTGSGSVLDGTTGSDSDVSVVEVEEEEVVVVGICFSSTGRVDLLANF